MGSDWMRSEDRNDDKRELSEELSLRLYDRREDE